MRSSKPRYSYKDFQWSSHSLIAKELDQLHAETVLDVGCGGGFIGRKLRYKPKQLIGIDIVPPDKKLPKYTKFLCYDLNKIDQSLPVPKVKAICLGDVLEHLHAPAKSFEMIKNYATAKTIFIISLPNMKFLPVKLLLAMRIRPRMVSGPFDRTHLHDFTYASAVRFMKKQGMQIEKVLVTPPPLPLLSTFFEKQLYFVYYISFWLARKWPSLFAYQTIVVARKRVNK